MTTEHTTKIDERIINICHLSLHDLLQTYYVNNKTPLCIWGIPGIGKSDVVRDRAKELAASQGKIFFDWNGDRFGREGLLEILRHADGIRKELVRIDIKIQRDKRALARPSISPADVTKYTEAIKLEEARKSALTAELEISDTVGDYFIFADLRLSQADPTDIKGLPNIREGQGTDWEPDKLMRFLSQPSAAGFLFLDEINQACESIQKAAFQLVHNKCAGETALSDNVMIVCACNDDLDGGNVYAMCAALCNRMDHVRLVPPSAKDWIDWAQLHDIDARVTSFIAWKPSCLLGDVSLVEEKGHKAYPTPRSWARFGKNIKGMTKNLVHDKARQTANGAIQYPLIYVMGAASVGTEANGQFQAFLKYHTTFDVLDILQHPEKTRQFDPGTFYAFIGAAQEYYKAQPVKTKKDRDALMTLFFTAANDMCCGTDASEGTGPLRAGQTEFAMLFISGIYVYHLRVLKDNAIPEYFKTHTAGAPQVKRVLDLMQAADMGSRA